MWVYICITHSEPEQHRFSGKVGGSRHQGLWPPRAQHKMGRCIPAMLAFHPGRGVTRKRSLERLRGGDEGKRCCCGLMANGKKCSLARVWVSAILCSGRGFLSSLLSSAGLMCLGTGQSNSCGVYSYFLLLCVTESVTEAGPTVLGSPRGVLGPRLSSVK